MSETTATQTDPPATAGASVERPALSKPELIGAWSAQLVVVAIFALAGPVPKLTGAEASIALFSELGAEPWGRYGVGLAEAVAMALLLTPWTAAFGGLLTVALMGGAIMGHATKLGISPSGVHPDVDGPALFGMAVVALIAGLVVTFLRRQTLLGMIRGIRN